MKHKGLLRMAANNLKQPTSAGVSVVQWLELILAEIELTLKVAVADRLTQNRTSLNNARQ